METFSQEDLRNLSPEDQQKAAVIAIWSARADVYGQDLNEKQLKKFSDLTNHFQPKTLIKLLDAHMTSEWGHRMPTPADVFKMAKKGLNLPSEDDATEIASEIIQTVENNGYWVNAKEFAEKEKEAEKELSELAWKVVEKLGGWGAVVRHLQSVGSARTTWIAQTRDLIKSVIRNENKKIEEKFSGIHLELSDLKSLSLDYYNEKERQ
jgi:DNA-directed RNA polymerase specialized sigma54-like protein